MTKHTEGPSVLADFSLFIVAAIWGSGFVATQYAVDSNMGTGLIMALRFSIAALLLLLIFFPRIRQMNRREFLTGLPAGIFLFLAFFTQTLGIRFTTPSNNAFLTATNVIMVPFITWVLHKHAPRLKSFFLALICLFGIFLLSWSSEGGMHLNLGDLLTLVCAFLFACHISYLDIAAKKIDVKLLSFLQMAVAAVLSLVSLLIFPPPVLSEIALGSGLAASLYLGVFSTCICFLIQTVAQQRTSATKAAIFLSTECLFGSLFSVLMGLEPFTANMLIGGLVIMSSIVLSEVDFTVVMKKKAKV